MSALTCELKPTPSTGDTRELVDYVVERCPGKNETEIRLALVKALRRFLRDSKVWREPLSPVPEIAGDPAYRFIAASSGLIHSVCEIKLTGGGTLPPPEYTCDDGRTVLFAVPIPVDAFPYAAMVPQRGDDHVPARILQKWGEAICNGALHELFANGQLNAATSWKALYDNDVSEALLDAQPRTAGTIRLDYGMEVI